MTVVSIHQPIYLPWLAYFDKIRRSDIHVVLDHVTVGKQDLCNRNKIRTPDGWKWLTIPIKSKGSRSTAIRDIEIVSGKWQKQHRTFLHENYSISRHWKDHRSFFNQLYGEKYSFLREPVFFSLWYMMEALEIKTPLRYSSKLNGRGQKSDLNLNICKELGATVYLSGPYGRDYLDIPSFEKAGIEVKFTDFQHPVYSQCHYQDFVPGLSAIDAIMNGYRFS